MESVLSKCVCFAQCYQILTRHRANQADKLSNAKLHQTQIFIFTQWPKYFLFCFSQKLNAGKRIIWIIMKNSSLTTIILDCDVISSINLFKKCTCQTVNGYHCSANTETVELNDEYQLKEWRKKISGILYICTWFGYCFITNELFTHEKMRFSPQVCMQYVMITTFCAIEWTNKKSTYFQNKHYFAVWPNPPWWWNRVEKISNIKELRDIMHINANKVLKLTAVLREWGEKDSLRTVNKTKTNILHPNCDLINGRLFLIVSRFIACIHK